MMSGWVDSLSRPFPDARIVVVMRDPAQCIPSVLKLMQFSWRGCRWKHDDYAASMRELIRISLTPSAILAMCLLGIPRRRRLSLIIAS